LRGAQTHCAISRLWPNELRIAQSLVEEAHPFGRRPQHFDLVAAPASKQVHLAGEGILLQVVLDERAQAIHPVAKVSVTGYQPDARAAGWPDHRNTASTW